MPELRIGISGWRYAPWRGVFYPDDLAQRRELEYASRKVNSIEINGSFYSLQKPESYEKWAAETPDDFIFSVKGGRYITHMRRLKDVRVPLANFIASGPLRLGRKLGPILWQFPPHLPYRRERFAEFMAMLPRTHEEAGRLAEENSLQALRGEGRSSIEPVHEGPMRHAFEIRHPSFLDGDFVELLRAHGAALVFADSAGKWPYAEDATADFVYLRLHGASELYASGYSDEELRWWADRIGRWMDGREPRGATRVGPRARSRKKRDAFVYFDNDVKVHAPFDAMRLREMMTGPPVSESA